MKNLFLIFTCVVLVCSGCASNTSTVIKTSSAKQNIEQGDTLYMAVNLPEGSILQGQFDFDELHGGAGAMLYPGDAASFLVGIAVHAAVANSAKNKQKESVVERANQVVEKYQKRSRDFSAESFFVNHSGLLQDRYPFSILPYVGNAEEDERGVIEETSWLLTSNPIFYMTQDERELVLHNVVRLHHVNDPRLVLYENLIEVASVSIAEEPVEAYWLTEGRFEALFGELLVASMALASDDILHRFSSAPKTQMTFRYRQGGERKIQRGTLVQAQCERIVLRTLRGWLRSLPSSSVDDAATLPQSEPCNPVKSASAS